MIVTTLLWDIISLLCSSGSGLRHLPLALLHGLLKWKTIDASGMWPGIPLDGTKGCFPSINHWRRS